MLKNSEILNTIMNFSIFEKRKTEIFVGALIFQILIFLFFLSGTLFIAAFALINPSLFIEKFSFFIDSPEDIYDPAIRLFPFMFYISYALTIIVILIVNLFVLLVKGNNTISETIRKKKFVSRIIERMEWQDNISGWRKSFRLVLLFLMSFLTIIILALGFVEIGLLFSPMNTFYFTLFLSLLLVWLALGIKIENIKTCYLFISGLSINLILHISAVVIAEDEQLLPFSLSYQIFALFVLIIRLIKSNHRNAPRK